MRPGDAGRQRRPAGPAGQPRRRGDAERLADDQAGADGERGRRRSRPPNDSATPALASANTGITTKALTPCSACSRRSSGAVTASLADSRACSASCWPLLVMTSRSPVSVRSKSSRMRAGVGRELGGVDPRARRDGERGQHAGDRGVHARLVDEEPQHRRRAARYDAEMRTPRRFTATRAASDRGRRSQRAPVHRRGVEERDHQHRDHVVDDRQRGEEHLESGRRAGAASASTPSAKAMSVAIGIAQPPRGLGRGDRQDRGAPARPCRRARRRRAAPPGARDDSSPTSSSRLISRPTSRKNTAIRPSFTQCWSGERQRVRDRGRRPGGSARRRATSWAHGELAAASATSAATSSTTPPAASVWTKVWKNRRGAGAEVTRR